MPRTAPDCLTQSISLTERIFAQLLDSHSTATLMDTHQILLEQEILKGSKLDCNSATDLFLGQPGDM